MVERSRMREILDRCVALDELAAKTYSEMATACSDDRLRSLFETRAREEEEHTSWWRELTNSFNEGLVPDIISEPEMVVSKLDGHHRLLSAEVSTDLGATSDRELVSIATKLEFYMLDPIFEELLDLLEPGRTEKRQRAYDRHIAHIVDAIKIVAGEDPLLGFLADVLVRTARDNRQLARSASRDPLTGLYNRRALDGRIKQWLAWSHRYDHHVGFLLIDLDRFKDINDGFGHDAGDEALVVFARMLREKVRGSDLVARWGGDEFAVVAPESDEEDLRTLAERLVESARGLRIETGSGDVGVTLSIGAALVAPGGQGPVHPSTVIAGADRSLYEAKEAGRDRVGPVNVVP